VSPDATVFPAAFDDEFEVGSSPGERAYFGRDVLRGLVAGIDEFIAQRHERWRTFRSLGPVLLGSAMWIDDRELIAKISELTGACIVIPKQERAATERWRQRPLSMVNEHTPGLPISAFRELEGLAPRVGGSPAIVGPYDPIDEQVVSTIRTIGYRRMLALPPIIHAKPTRSPRP
jgi:hypothetical protein